MDLKSLNPLWRDKKFWAAITTALLFWVILFWIAPPRSLFLSWPLYAPGKFLMLALVYPVLEELVFRGLVQGTIYNTQVGKKQFAKLSIANISASLFFVLVHFINHPPLWALSVFVPSLIFGYFRDKYLSVVPAVVLHIFYNGGYFLLYPPL